MQQIAMEPNIISDMIETCNIKNYTHLKKRLNFVRRGYSLSDTVLLYNLRNSFLITDLYNERCLEVDRWYLKRPRYTYKTDPRHMDIRDPLKHLFLRTIIQALSDVCFGRPCDWDLWEKDFPPGKKQCTPSLHICTNDAEDFLRDLTDDELNFVGLSSDTIASYVIKLKKDRRLDRSFC